MGTLEPATTWPPLGARIQVRKLAGARGQLVPPESTGTVVRIADPGAFVVEFDRPGLVAVVRSFEDQWAFCAPHLVPNGAPVFAYEPDGTRHAGRVCGLTQTMVQIGLDSGYRFWVGFSGVVHRVPTG